MTETRLSFLQIISQQISSFEIASSEIIVDPLDELKDMIS